MSDFNSLSAEASPSLTDNVFTARGTTAGAERKPTLTGILALFLNNGGGIKSTAVIDVAKDFSAVAPGETSLSLTTQIPVGTYLAMGRITLEGAGLTAGFGTILIQLVNASDDLAGPPTEVSDASVMQPVSGVSGPFMMTPIFGRVVHITSPATKWLITSSIIPTGTITLHIEGIFIPISPT